MPKVTQPTARNDIYTRGLRVQDSTTKRGYRLDRSQPADENDKVLIPKGTKYYRWSINFGGTFMQLTPPKQSQLTSSPFLSTAYDINERMAEVQANDVEDIESLIEEFKTEIEELRDTTGGSLENMPEGLKESDTGNTLQERIDACQEAIDALESIDTDFEEYEIDEEAQDLEEEQVKAEEAKEEWINEKIGEIQDCAINV